MQHGVERFTMYMRRARLVFAQDNSWTRLSWRTADIGEEANVGGAVKFLFNGSGPEFEVLEITPQQPVAWKCVAGPRNGLIRISFSK